MRCVLNVGGGSKLIPIPAHFDGWRHDLLDIDPRGNPDVCADARELQQLLAATYDAIYCSHNLEHYHRHDAAKVVRGFHHVLKPDGFVHILVPDLLAVIRHVAQNNMDIDDTLYSVQEGPILVRDVIYGYHVEIERSGNDFYSHKTCFSPATLISHMSANGFPSYAVGSEGFQILGYFFKAVPGDEVCRMLGITWK